MKYKTFAIIGMACIGLTCHADDFDKAALRSAFDDFVNEINADFNDFRREMMTQFTEFLKDPWKEMQSQTPVEEPKEKPLPPVVLPPKPQEPPVPTPQEPIAEVPAVEESETPDVDVPEVPEVDVPEEVPVVDIAEEPIKENPLIEEDIPVTEPIAPPLVIEPVEPEPQPEPVQPIPVQPVLPSQNWLEFTFYGTPLKVRFSEGALPKLRSVNEAAVAEGIQRLYNKDMDMLISDCLALRKDMQLGDWEYLQLLKDVCDAATTDINVGNLLLGYIFMQSGYKTRFGFENNRLYMLYGSKHCIYEKRAIIVKGQRLYSADDMPQRLRLSAVEYPGEKALSMMIEQAPKLAKNLTEQRVRTARYFDDMKISVTSNRNLLDLYANHPVACITDNDLSRYLVYGSIPASDEMKSVLYPQLRQAIAGLNKYDAVNKLCHWVQTGFVYGYDDEVWGHDRAFFADESLFYPYCDCEDRSILLTRIVRDLLGIKCAFVHYPGHLATAVSLGEEARGDYFNVDGDKYVVCDPTFIGADIGMTMTGCDNSTAELLMLSN